jgi:hypothetical protein
MISLPIANVLEYAFFDTIRPNVPLAIFILSPVFTDRLLFAYKITVSQLYISYPGDYSDYLVGIIALSSIFDTLI